MEALSPRRKIRSYILLPQSSFQEYFLFTTSRRIKKEDSSPNRLDIKGTENIYSHRPRGLIPPKAGQHRRESSRIPTRPLRFRRAPVPDRLAENRTPAQIAPTKVFSDANRWKNHCLMMSCLGRDEPSGPQPTPSCRGTYEQRENPPKSPTRSVEDHKRRSAQAAGKGSSVP